MSASVESMLRRALEHQGAGRLDEAESIYTVLRARTPQNPDVLHGLGLLAHQRGRHAEAVELIRTALSCYKQATTPAVAYARAYNNLGNVQLALGELAQGAASFAEAARIDSRYTAAYHNLGKTQSKLNDHAAAAESYRKALRLEPDNAEICCSLGLAYIKLDQLDNADVILRRAIALRPDHALAHLSLGYVYIKRSEWKEALTHTQRALEIEPDSFEALVNMGEILQQLDLFDHAVQYYERALMVRPDSAKVRVKLGGLYYSLWQLREALACYEQAVELGERGAFEAEGIIDDSAIVYDVIAFTSNFIHGHAPQDVYAVHKRYAERFETPLKAFWTTHANTRDRERRLKIGYVSPDLRLHPVAFFLEPILAHHDKHGVEVYCYYNNTIQDTVTARLMSHADHWIPCKELTDEALAARIRADGIDILVDLAGHTRDNRLLAFARKPAPVQVSYLGYPATTGLTAMDWRLSHADADPPGSSEVYNSERLYRLPRSLWCYRPPTDVSEIEPETAARRNGVITFGSMNNIVKMLEATVATWAELLKRVPGSRLVITSVKAGSAQQRVQERFAAQGIDVGRLELHDRMSQCDFHGLYARIDITLDPYPVNGNTTTCESLYLGVPVITLMGDCFAGRFGYHLLKTIGLSELVARDEAEYVAIAEALARDLDRLDALRSGMRARLEASALRDEAGMTRDIEAAYRAMWREWCAAGE